VVISLGFEPPAPLRASRPWIDVIPTAQAVHLGSGIHDAITRHNAVWRPWLDHPRIAPILEAMQQVAHRHAQLPVAPRALALVEREKLAGTALSP
jgi:hypothetical protein